MWERADHTGFRKFSGHALSFARHGISPWPRTCLSSPPGLLSLPFCTERNSLRKSSVCSQQGPCPRPAWLHRQSLTEMVLRTVGRRRSGRGFAPGSEPGKGRGNGGGRSRAGGEDRAPERQGSCRLQGCGQGGARLWVSELGWRVLRRVCGWCWDLTSVWTVLLWPPREEQTRTAPCGAVTKRRRGPEPRPCDAATCPFGPLTASNLSPPCCFPGDKRDRVP